MYGLISLDWNNVSEKQRDTFYEYLEEKKWNKYTDLTTTWYVNFGDKFTEESALEWIEARIKEAARKTGVSSYKVVANISENKPTEFSEPKQTGLGSFRSLL